MGFYNYISPRLRREAKAQLVDIQGSFQKTYTGLLEARRSEAAVLSIRSQRFQEQLLKIQAEVAEKDALIATLEAQLNRSSE